MAEREVRLFGMPVRVDSSMPDDIFVIERRVLSRDNARELWEWVPGKAFYDPDGTISGLTVFTAAGRVKACFGDWILRHDDGSFTVEHTTLKGTA